MKLTEYTDTDTWSCVVQLTITMFDMYTASKTDKNEWELLNKCNKSDKVSDKLLALHTIAKKIEGVD